VGRLALGELERQDAHPDEVRAVDALEGLGDDGLDAEQRGALRGPVARRARAVLLAAEHDERDARLRVVLRRVVDRGLLAREEVARESALDARYELVAQPDVGEGATDHDLVVAAARAVGVEVASVDPTLREVLARGAVGLDRAGRG